MFCLESFQMIADGVSKFLSFSFQVIIAGRLIVKKITFFFSLSSRIMALVIVSFFDPFTPSSD